MTTRVKVFTYISGSGSTVIETTLEDRINEFLNDLDGSLLEISQSESERAGGGHHVTICIWYVPRKRAKKSRDANAS